MWQPERLNSSSEACLWLVKIQSRSSCSPKAAALQMLKEVTQISNPSYWFLENICAMSVLRMRLEGTFVIFSCITQFFILALNLWFIPEHIVVAFEKAASFEDIKIRHNSELKLFS